MKALPTLLSITGPLLLVLTAVFPAIAVSQSYQAGQSYLDEQGFVEYLAGNLPIILSVPHGGYLEPDEEPLAAAQRELREETGYESSQWISLGNYAVDGNRGAGTAHLYLARNAYRVAEPDADDLEEQKLLFLTRTEIKVALRAGEFKVLAWSAVVALALEYLAKQKE